MDRDEEEDFYAFILDLHQRSLLTLPVNNADALYQRFERRRRAERISKLMGIFFLRVPLINPDRLLSRTIGAFRWMYTLPAFIAWTLLCAAAVTVAITRFDDLLAPAATVLEGQNLILMWVALIGLKVIHEFGHAYACKSFGGHVPEMGAFFILFTPVAYVDATDSWTFPSARRRAIVTLGGVYFESIVGIIALFVWAATESSLLNAFAYQVVILATVTTAAFNLNPLLRYDAYYLVSDAVAIPNLRARCQEALAAITKRVLFGLKTDTDGDPLPIRPGLAAFGFAQLAYRVVMLGTIAAVLILKFHTPGLALAGVMVGLTLFKSISTVVRYVLTSPESAPVRVRASLATFGVGGVVTAAVLAVPIPWPVHADGIVTFEHVRTVRAPEAGVLDALHVRAGETAHAGDPLASLADPQSRAEYAALLAEIEAAGARIANAALDSPAEIMINQTETDRLQARLDRLEHRLASLDVRAPDAGRVLELLAPHPGVRVETGDPIMVLASGEPEAVFHVRSFEFDAVDLAEGDQLTCRAAALPDREITGTVTHIARVGVRDVDPHLLRARPGGLVPISPVDGRTAEPYFEIRVRLHPREAELAGAGLVAKFPTLPRTTASVIERRVVRFLNRTKQGADG
jgi:putative peptide zinc metalloprotease protein